MCESWEPKPQLIVGKRRGGGAFGEQIELPLFDRSGILPSFPMRLVNPDLINSKGAFQRNDLQSVLLVLGRLRSLTGFGYLIRSRLTAAHPAGYASLRPKHLQSFGAFLGRMLSSRACVRFTEIFTIWAAVCGGV
jgi:hypothetical protein